MLDAELEERDLTASTIAFAQSRRMMAYALTSWATASSSLGKVFAGTVRSLVEFQKGRILVSKARANSSSLIVPLCACVSSNCHSRRLSASPATSHWRDFQ